MSLLITDTLYAGTTPLSGVIVAFAPQVPLYFQFIGGAWSPVLAPWRAPVTNGSGLFSTTLPWPSEVDPLLLWTALVPGLAAPLTLTGTVPEGVAGPLSLDTLKQTYGWS